MKCWSLLVVVILVWVSTHATIRGAECASTYKELWVATTNNNGYGLVSPFIGANGTVVVYDNYNLYVFNPNNGSKIASLGISNLGSPIIYSNTTGLFYYVGQQSTLYAITSDTKTVSWSVRLYPTISRSTISLDASDPANLRLYVGGNQVLFSINANTGKLVWISLDLGKDVISSPTVTPSKTLLVSDGYQLFEVDPADGYVLFNESFASRLDFNDPLYIAGDELLIFASNSLRAYSVKNNEQPTLVWSTENLGFYNKPGYYNGTLYLGSRNSNFLYILKSTSGEVIRKMTLPASVAATPTLDNLGNIYVPISAVYVYSLSPALRTNWIYIPSDKIGGDFNSPLPVGNTTVYFSTSRGFVVGLQIINEFPMRIVL